MFNKKGRFNKNARMVDWQVIVHGIVEMLQKQGDMPFLISEIRKQYADKNKKTLKESKKAGLKEQQMAQFLVGHPTPEQEREQFLAQMESQGFDRASFENAQKATMPKSMLPAKEKPMFENTKIKGKFNGKK